MVEENSGKEFISFGKYNMDRDSVYVKAGSPYHSMPDLVGKRIATSGTGGAMLMQRAMFKKQVRPRPASGRRRLRRWSCRRRSAMPAALSKGDRGRHARRHRLGDPLHGLR